MMLAVEGAYEYAQSLAGPLLQAFTLMNWRLGFALLCRHYMKHVFCTLCCKQLDVHLRGTLLLAPMQKRSCTHAEGTHSGLVNGPHLSSEALVATTSRNNAHYGPSHQLHSHPTSLIPPPKPLPDPAGLLACRFVLNLTFRPGIGALMPIEELGDPLSLGIDATNVGALVWWGCGLH